MRWARSAEFGVAIDSVEDMERLFDGIALDTISTSMTINATASILLTLYVAVAKRTGAETRKLSGTVQNDILKEYISRGDIYLSGEPCYALVTDIFEWAAQGAAGVEHDLDLRISHEGGRLDAVQEVAFTLADGMTTCRLRSMRGWMSIPLRRG